MITVIGKAQVKIGSNPTSIGSSSALELESNNKALLVTRVANTSAITSPINGMIIYDSSGSCIKVYQAGMWKAYVPAMTLPPAASITQWYSNAVYDSLGNLKQTPNVTVASSVISNIIPNPPASPSSGDRYIIPSAATGSWVNKTNYIAQWSGSAWIFTQYDSLTNINTQVLVTSSSTNLIWTGTGWAVSTASSPSRVFAVSSYIAKQPFTINDILLVSSSTWMETLIYKVTSNISLNEAIIPGTNVKSIDNTPAGTICAYAASTAPIGWRFCDGSLISRTTYADLFSIIGTLYGAGDGSTTFALPDLRGEFIRGNDNGRGVDAGRALGSSQAGAIQSHTHTVVATTSAGSFVVGSGAFNTNGAFNNSTITSSATGGTETRPRNVSLNYIIKY